MQPLYLLPSLPRLKMPLGRAVGCHPRVHEKSQREWVHQSAGGGVYGAPTVHGRATIPQGEKCTCGCVCARVCALVCVCACESVCARVYGAPTVDGLATIPQGEKCTCVCVCVCVCVRARVYVCV